MLLIYYALVPIVGSLGIAIIVFCFVIFGRCVNIPPSLPRSTRRRPGGEIKSSSTQLNLSPYSASSFKYKKGLDNVQQQEEENDEEIMECVVCLLGFEDDEEVRQLHSCKHSFHVACIDMWMYSHSNCPICRTPVHRLSAFDSRTDHHNSSTTHISISP